MKKILGLDINGNILFEVYGKVFAIKSDIQGGYYSSVEVTVQEVLFPQIYHKPKPGSKTIVEFSTYFENDTKTEFFIYQEDSVESSYHVLTDMFEPADTTGFELAALKNNLKLAQQKVYELEQQIKNFDNENSVNNHY